MPFFGRQAHGRQQTLSDVSAGTSQPQPEQLAHVAIAPRSPTDRMPERGPRDLAALTERFVDFLVIRRDMTFNSNDGMSLGLFE